MCSLRLVLKPGIGTPPPRPQTSFFYAPWPSQPELVVPPEALFKMADPANASDNGSLPGNPPAAVARHPGHELPFVTPSTYLHLRTPTAGTPRPILASSAAQATQSHAIPPEKPPMTPLDRDQVQGLVSNDIFHSLFRSSLRPYSRLVLVLMAPCPVSAYRSGRSLAQGTQSPSLALTGCQSYVGEASAGPAQAVVCCAAARAACWCGVPLCEPL